MNWWQQQADSFQPDSAQPRAQAPQEGRYWAPPQINSLEGNAGGQVLLDPAKVDGPLKQAIIRVQMPDNQARQLHCSLTPRIEFVGNNNPAPGAEILELYALIAYGVRGGFERRLLNIGMGIHFSVGGSFLEVTPITPRRNASQTIIQPDDIPEVQQAVTARVSGSAWIGSGGSCCDATYQRSVFVGINQSITQLRPNGAQRFFLLRELLGNAYTVTFQDHAGGNISDVTYPAGTTGAEEPVLIPHRCGQVRITNTNALGGLVTAGFILDF